LLGDLCEARGARAEAELFTRQAVNAGEKLFDSGFRRPNTLDELAQLYYRRAYVLISLGRDPEAEKAARRMTELRRYLLEDLDAPSRRLDLATDLSRYATVLQMLGRTPDVRTVLREARSQLRDLPRELADGPQGVRTRTLVLAD